MAALTPEQIAALDDLQKRIFARVVVDKRTGCWNWQGCVQGNGYGRMTFERKTDYVHRHAYRAWVGPIRKGMDLCHTCDNRRCCRPGHLFQGTRLDNMRDAQKKGRVARGERLAATRRGDKNYCAKLTWDKVRAIRKSDKSSAELADEYGVDSSNINCIRRFATWKEGFALLR